MLKSQLTSKPARAQRLLLLPAAALIATLPSSADHGAARAQAAAGPPAPSVVVEAVQYTDLKGATTFSGRVEAIDKIELRTRVAGLITRREFQEGAEVQKGQLLFEIDRRPYEIAVAQAESNLLSSQAALEDSADTYNRTQELVTRQVSSGATLVSAKSHLAQAKAKVGFDEAQVRQAKLNLDYTQIRAEIAGRVGRAAHAVGDYVNEGSSPLATLISTDTVYVAFAVPRVVVAGLRKTDAGVYDADVEIQLGDGTVHPHKGQIAFVDIEASAQTNTIVIRAAIPNPDRSLIPQELINATIVDSKATKTLVVSQSALLLDQLGSYVLTVDDGNKVAIRRFETGTHLGSLITVKTGLTAGERVIVSGHLKAQPGMVVDPQIVPIEVSESAGNPTP